MTTISEPNTILEINDAHNNNWVLVIPKLPTAYFLSSTFRNESSPFQIASITPPTTAIEDGCGNGQEWDPNNPVTNPSTSGTSGCPTVPDVCNEDPKQKDRRVTREMNIDWKNFRLYMQSVTLPQTSVNVIDIPTQFSTLKRSGKISFGDLSTTMMVSENFLNYNAMLYWLYALHNPEERNKLSGRGEIEEFFTEIYLILWNNHREKVAEYKFIDAFPSNIGSLDFSYKGAEKLTVPVTWSHSGMLPANNFVLRFV
jgi:hypothetical protein